MLAARMYPSYGVPWPRLERAAARLTELHSARAEPGRVSAMLFFCGLKYLLSYRQACGRRLSHYLDDGLREAVHHTLPGLMKYCTAGRSILARSGRCHHEDTIEFRQLIAGFARLQERLPSSTAKWIGGHQENLVRLAFGIGVASRFSPESYAFVRCLLEKPIHFSLEDRDVLDSFQWHPDWSLALAT